MVLAKFSPSLVDDLFTSSSYAFIRVFFCVLGISPTSTGYTFYTMPFYCILLFQILVYVMRCCWTII